MLYLSTRPSFPMFSSISFLRPDLFLLHVLKPNFTMHLTAFFFCCPKRHFHLFSSKNSVLNKTLGLLGLVMHIAELIEGSLASPSNLGLDNLHVSGYYRMSGVDRKHLADTDQDKLKAVDRIEFVAFRSSWTENLKLHSNLLDSEYIALHIFFGFDRERFDRNSGCCRTETAPEVANTEFPLSCILFPTTLILSVSHYRCFEIVLFWYDFLLWEVILAWKPLFDCQIRAESKVLKFSCFCIWKRHLNVSI